MLLTLLEKVLVDLATELDLNYEDQDAALLEDSLDLLADGAEALRINGREIPHELVHVLRRFSITCVAA